MVQNNRTRHRKWNRNWIEINRSKETKKARWGRRKNQRLVFWNPGVFTKNCDLSNWGSNSLEILFFDIFLIMFLKKIEKEFGDKLKTNNIWYINHTPWTGMIVFDCEKLNLNCIFTLCVNTCMSRFEIRESIQSLLLAKLKTGHGLSITCKRGFENDISKLLFRKYDSASFGEK